MQSKNSKSTPRTYPLRADLLIKKGGNMKMEVAKSNPDEVRQQILCHKLVLSNIFCTFCDKKFL